MRDKYTPPKLGANAFDCPYCRVCMGQTWEDISSHNLNIKCLENTPQDAYLHTYNTQRSVCDKCKGECLWIEERMVFPDTGTAPQATEYMSTDIRKIYDEASRVLSKSPRSAAALLRLALEKQCKELGSTGKNLHEDITFIVETKNVSSEVEDAMNDLRIAGNLAVHAGIINLHEDEKNVPIMFDLINFIIEELIARPQKRKEFHTKALSIKKPKDTQ